MKAFAGYLAIDGFLGSDQIEYLDGLIADSVEQNNDEHIVQYKDGEKTFLYFKREVKFFPYCRVYKDNRYVCVLWGSVQEDVVNAGVSSGILSSTPNEARPYHFFAAHPGTLYLLSKPAKPPAEAGFFTSKWQKGVRVKTASGSGTIRDFDHDGVCVELDNDQDALHEFDIQDISKEGE